MNEWYLHHDGSLSLVVNPSLIQNRALALKWVVAARLGIADAQPLRMVERGTGRGWDCEVGSTSRQPTIQASWRRGAGWERAGC